MQFISLPDLAGTGASSNLYDLFLEAGITPPSSLAVAVMVYEVAGGPGSSRIGGPNVGPNRGIPITAGGNDSVKLDVLPRGGSAVEIYDLRQVFVWRAASDTLGVTAIFL